MTEFEHPIRQGAILRRLHEAENTEVLLEVVSRFEDLDDGHYEYELSCPTHTGYYQYRDEDLEDCFADTGLTNEEMKPRMDNEIRSLYEELHEEHGEHSFTEVVDGDTGKPAGEQCIHCLKKRGGQT